MMYLHPQVHEQVIRAIARITSRRTVEQSLRKDVQATEPTATMTKTLKPIDLLIYS